MEAALADVRRFRDNDDDDDSSYDKGDNLLAIQLEMIDFSFEPPRRKVLTEYIPIHPLIQ